MTTKRRREPMPSSLEAGILALAIARVPSFATAAVLRLRVEA